MCVPCAFPSACTPGMGAPVIWVCLLLLLRLTAGTSAKPHYVVVIPTELYHPHTGMLSVHLSDLNETVRVTVQLERGDGPSSVITLLEREVQEPHLLENVHFQVPAPSGGKVEVADLHVLIQGDSLQFSERKKIQLQVLEPRTFVQTDKAVYKPGQTVKFRIVSLDKDFVPSTRKLPLVTLQDPSGNHIAQWRDVTPQKGIVDLSLPLSAELALGTYTIKVEWTTHTFSVEEYVLPKFEVTIELPPTLTVLDETLLMRVCGRNTYGNPVLGRVQASVSLQKEYNEFALIRYRIENPCLEFTGQTGRNGCFSREVRMAPFHPDTSGYTTVLQATASLVDEETGVEINRTEYSKIMSEISAVSFEESDATYMTGVPYIGKMLLEMADGSVLKNESLQLFVSHGDVRKNQTLLMDESGRASFKLDTSGWTGTVTLRGLFKEEDPSSVQGRISPRYLDDSRQLQPLDISRPSFLKIHSLREELPCNQAQQLQVDYVIAREALGSGSKSLDFIFLVVAKGTIARILQKGLDLRTGAELKGSFSVELPVSADLAPSAKVLGYMVLPDGEMATDGTLLHVAKCLQNKVKLVFSRDRALPGSEFQLQVLAAPGSLCAIRAVDQRVLLMKPKAELSINMVYNSLPHFPQRYHPTRSHASCGEAGAAGPPLHPCNLHWKGGRRCRLFKRWITPLPQPLNLFQRAALTILTNSYTRTPCERRDPFSIHDNVGMIVYPNPVPEPAPRAYFTDTWLWDLVPVG
uniref:Alpha-2-macroglobulin bait region domain-containing protein n=1 Tax=Pelusios castaneus TaxID=367368 RepID=A0A8C8S568_9SAUR